jgi:hypothetical protein
MSYSDKQTNRTVVYLRMPKKKAIEKANCSKISRILDVLNVERDSKFEEPKDSTSSYVI